MKEIEVYCDNCGCLTSDKDNIPYSSHFNHFNHLCSSCRNRISYQDKRMEYENNKTKESAKKQSIKEWEKQKKKLFR